MNRSKQFLELVESLQIYESVADLVTYDQYINILDHITDVDFNETIDELIIDEGILDSVRNLGSQALNYLSNTFKSIKTFIITIADTLKTDINFIIAALREKSIFGILKAARFSIAKLLMSVKELAAMVRRGLFKVFKELHNTRIIKKLEQGLISFDVVLEQYPILKKVTGIAVAGLLLYMWWNMTFIGDFDYDFNFTDIAAALAGNFTLTNLFASPDGLMLISLFVAGMIGNPVSVAWLAVSELNLLLGLIYTGYIKLKDKDTDLVRTLKDIIKQKKNL